MKIRGTREELLRALGSIPVRMRTPAINETLWQLQDEGTAFRGTSAMYIDITNDDYAAGIMNSMLVSNRLAAS